MKLTKSRPIIIASLCLLAFWLFYRSQNPHQVPKPNFDIQGRLEVHPDLAKLYPGQKPKLNPEDFYKPHPGVLAQIASIFTAPIEFYGKVIDQHGNAVEGADVEITVNDDPTMSRKRNIQRRTTDASGLFSITGVHGMSIFVRVSKLGYYRVMADPTQKGSKASERVFNYGFNEGPGLHKADEANPAVLDLYKADDAEPLLHQTKGAWPISNDGKPRKIPMNPSLPEGPYGIVVQCWIDEKQKNSNGYYTRGQYSWKMKLSVPDGELAVRTGRMAFEAPLEGYVPTVEYSMSTTPLDRRWDEVVKGSYFVRFKDGHFGRFDFRFAAYDDSDIVFESYLNPKTGSRNLVANPDQD